MKITLLEWHELHQLAQAARAQLKALDDRLTELMFAHHQAGNEDERMLLTKLSVRVGEATSELYASQYAPQSEWTGGPSDEPRNFTYREPHAVPHGHAFPRDQIAPLRDGAGEVRLPKLNIKETV